MTTQAKIIKNKLGILELAQHLGNVSQACKVMGYSRRAASTALRNCTIKGANWPCRRFREASLY